MKKKKRILGIILACIMIMSISGTCMATEASFSKVYVDSNTWTHIKTLKKETTTKTATLNLKAIYKANGATSNYVKIETKVQGGYAKISYVGVMNTIPIPSSRQSAGKSVPLYAMGYNPRLDCRITGSWIVH